MLIGYVPTPPPAPGPVMYVAEDPGGLADTPLPVIRSPSSIVPETIAVTVSVVPLMEPVKLTLEAGITPPHVPAPQPLAYTVVSKPVLIWKVAVTEPPPVAEDVAADAAVMVKFDDVRTLVI